MQHRPKRSSPYLRNSSSTAHLPLPPPPAFRTLLKRRNDTIPASQLYEHSPLPLHPARNSTHSQPASETALAPPPALPIKEYVKTIATRPQGRQREPAAAERRETARGKEDRDGQRSARSTRSVASSCRGLKREAVEGREREREKEGRSLEEVEKRVEALIAETLNQFKKDPTTSLSLSQHLCKIDPQNPREKQLEDLLTWVREQAERAQQPLGERLEDLNRKILLIQKLLAQGTVEGELMQEVYFNWKSQRGNTTSFSKSSVLRESGKYNSNPPLLRQQAQAKAKQVVGRYDSTSKAAFQRPSKEFYLAAKDKRSSYSANRQPLPRSSYAAQFLNYGHLAPYAHKPSAVRQEPEVSLAVTASTYQQEYKEKLAMTSPVGFRDLDCYRDKFARTDMSFMNCSKKQPAPHHDPRKIARMPAAKENLNASSIKRSQESLLGCMNMSCSSLFRSEHQKEYYWHNTLHTEESVDAGKKGTGMKAEIKDRRMERLKESFRALAKRR